MGKIVRLTESDINRLVKKIVSEQHATGWDMEGEQQKQNPTNRATGLIMDLSVRDFISNYRDQNGTWKIKNGAIFIKDSRGGEYRIKM